ncbi:MAG: phosphotransferase [Candidatus Alcyoniella australis]|nr:phosphotransferase [Candidatus Alcyoniella australis]
MKQLLPTLNAQFGVTAIHLLDIISWNAIFEAWGPGIHAAVKVYNPADREEERVAPELIANIQRDLYNSGNRAVVPPLLNKKGELVLCSFGYRIILYPWIVGHVPTSRDISKCAAWLENFHRTDYQTIIAKYINSPRQFRPTIMPVDWYDQSKAIWKEAQSRLRDAGVDMKMLRQFTEGEDLANKLLQDYPMLIEKTSLKLLHGDFKPSNVLITEDRKLAVLDFDCIQLGPSEVDTAIAALSFAGADWNGGKVDEYLLLSFLEKYRKRSELNGLAMDNKRITAALRWIPLRALSFSFKEEQIMPRLQLAKQLAKWCMR